MSGCVRFDSVVCGLSEIVDGGEGVLTARWSLRDGSVEAFSRLKFDQSERVQ